jgi:two-component system response regulator DegU
MDLAMPRMDGLTAAVRLGEVFPQIRIVILTIHDDREVRELVRKAGLPFVVKQADVTSLLAEIRRLSRPAEG